MYRYHTKSDVCTTALLRTKPSPDDDSGFGQGFEEKVSLLLARNSPEQGHV